MQCPPGFKIVREGLANVCVPDPELYKRSDGVYEPAWAPVFYNPHMVTNRDIASAFLRTIKAVENRLSVVVDAMCSTGVRGIRFAKEVPDLSKVFMIDIDANAIAITKLNAELNGITQLVSIEVSDCREFLYRAKREGIILDYIDVDPFGSPAPFTQAALETVRSGGIVSFTATDLAPLEGKYPRKLMRRYGIVGKKVGVSKHVAIRNLIAFIAKVGAIVDKYIVPLYSYYDRHYVRIYVKVFKGKSKSYEVLDKCIGAISYCNNCGYWSMGKEIEDKCPICGSRTDVVLGTWICDVVNPSIAKSIAKEISKYSWYSDRSKEIAKHVEEEAAVGNVLPYRISLICKYLKRNMPKISRVIDALRQQGYLATRAREYHDAIVSNAPMSEVLSVIKNL